MSGGCWPFEAGRSTGDRRRQIAGCVTASSPFVTDQELDLEFKTQDSRSDWLMSDSTVETLALKPLSGFALTFSGAAPVQFL